MIDLNFIFHLYTYNTDSCCCCFCYRNSAVARQLQYWPLLLVVLLLMLLSLFRFVLFGFLFSVRLPFGLGIQNSEKKLYIVLLLLCSYFCYSLVWLCWFFCFFFVKRNNNKNPTSLYSLPLSLSLLSHPLRWKSKPMTKYLCGLQLASVVLYLIMFFVLWNTLPLMGSQAKESGGDNIYITVCCVQWQFVWYRLRTHYPLYLHGNRCEFCFFFWFLTNSLFSLLPSIHWICCKTHFSI